jgi:hypothetical protein
MTLQISAEDTSDLRFILILEELQKGAKKKQVGLSDSFSYCNFTL